MPKARPKGVVDGEPVNIPAPCFRYPRATHPGGPAPERSRASRKGEGDWFPKRSEGEAGKNPGVMRGMTVLKLTQVGKESILRRSRELSLRN